MESALAQLVGTLDATRQAREALYVWFHQHPELSLQELQTASKIRSCLDALQLSHMQVGETGTVCVLDNGPGPVVAIRADIDGLPVQERSGKPYASTATQIDAVSGHEEHVAHACGHDFHIMGVLGALEAFAANLDCWNGTLVAVFQPAEEAYAGSRVMLANGVREAMPKPDVYLGQHVLPMLPAGFVGTHPGPFMSQAFSAHIEVWGKGTHGSMPEKGVDPILLASNIVTRLHTVVAREIEAKDTAVLTVGALHAGVKANVIPETAELRVNTRAYTREVSDKLRSAIIRIVRGECIAAGSPREPEITFYDEYPLTDNNPVITSRVRDAFDAYFDDEAMDLGRIPASEDFSIIPDALGVPYTYWGVGGFADWENAPGNHSPTFAPDLQPTLDRAAEAMIVAAAAWLVDEDEG